jgi:hypothetical protein
VIAFALFIRLHSVSIFAAANPKISIRSVTGADGETRLRDHAGIDFRQDAGKVFVDGLAFGGPAEQLGIDWDWEVVGIEQAADRPPKELFYIPALLLVAFVYLLQMRRKTQLEQDA